MAKSRLQSWMAKAREWRRSLSGRLLYLTALFVFIAEIFVFVPSISKFRLDWLSERLEAAQLATLAVEAAPDAVISEQMATRLLANAEVEAISKVGEGARELVLAMGMPPSPPVYVDLRRMAPVSAIYDAFAAMLAPPGRYLRVVGAPSLGGGMPIEIIVPEAPLKKAMYGYAWNIFALSIVIAVFTAILVFISLRRMFVKPMLRFMRSMTAFQKQPEDERNIIALSGRQDEIGEAEAALRDMQFELKEALRRKERLAGLGAGVAKINHDLRNVLASAQLMSDRLAKSEDPRVQKMAPRLIQALGRAVRLCQDTLQYGRADELRLKVSTFPFADLVEEIGISVDDEEDAPVPVVYLGPADLAVTADREQLFRVLLNISRNAAQAIRANKEKDGAGKIDIDARPTADGVDIDIIDTGPGLPEKAQAHLFEPFKGSARPGGSGLGLAISAELVRAHGGCLTLLRTGRDGTVFRISLPPLTEDAAESP